VQDTWCTLIVLESDGWLITAWPSIDHSLAIGWSQPGRWLITAWPLPFTKKR